MFGLRQKLIFGLGGLLVILFLVGGLSVAVMHQFSTDLNTFLTENWRSVQYGQAMINDLEQLDDMAKAPTADAAKFIQDFDLNVESENANITLHPQEDELAATLTRQWRGVDLKTGAKVADECYRDEYLSLLNKPSAAAYSAIVDFSPKVKATAQAIINLNLDNMTPLQGHVKDLRDQAARLMLLLAAAGTALAAGFTIILGRSILQPLGTLTRSFREIEQGNLDLVVQVRSRDELHQLAEAFNSMAAKLREFRRTDRAKLVRTQRTTQLAVNSLPDAIAIINPDGIIELANDAARNLFQLTPGQSMTAMTDPRLPELYRWVTRERRPSPVQGYESSIEVGDATGQVRYFLPHAVPILDADGRTAPEERRLVGITLVLGDVTNLRRLDEMKSGLLSVVSHELKTPLTSIRMAVHLLLEERIGSLTTKQSELLVAARDDSDRLHKIIEGLLDMGRLESGRVELELQPKAVGQLVQEALAPIEASFHDRGITLFIDIPAGTPAVMVDSTRIDHVFSNLLGNALKFTPPGGKVSISAATQDGMVRLVVADSGPGIPPEHIGRIFDRFYRVTGPNRPGGAGLGLAIAKEIVQLHGGRIEVDSPQGQGSRFSFTLRQAGVPATAGERK